MRVLIYTRVSKSSQESENQLLQLQSYCKLMNYQIVDCITDKKSGSDPSRDGFQRIFEMASRREFDLLLFWALDRFSREGTRKTLYYLSMLESYGVSFKSFTEQYIDSSGIFKDAIISIISTLAKQERLRISERVKAGLDRSRSKGKVFGRPTITPSVQAKITKLYEKGLSARKIGEKLNIDHKTVLKYKSTGVLEFKL